MDKIWTAVWRSLENGVPNVLLDVGICAALLIVAVAIYIWMTPWEDLKLVRSGNTAAGVALGGMILAMAIPLAFSLKLSTHWIDLVVWGAFSLILMIVVFFAIDLLLRGLPERIREGHVGAAVVLASAKLAMAALIAAAVSG
jgi:putative membrane protein